MRLSTLSSRPAAFASAAAALTLAASLGTALGANAQLFTWDDTTGDNLWFTDGNWNIAGVPNGVGDSAVVGSPSPTFLNANASVDGLTVTAGGDLRFNSGSDLALQGDVANDGLITLDGTGSATELRIDVPLTLSGTGELVFGTGGVNTGVNIVGDNNSLGHVLTNAAGHTIRARGIGVLGRNTTNLVNAGTIVSDAGGNLLINARTSLINTGTIATAGGGTLTLSGLTLDNTGGTIDATNGNLTLTGVTLTGNSTVLGTLETTGTNTFETLTTAGSIRVTSGSDLLTGGILTNNGTITLDGTGSATELRIDADTTLAGNGQVVIGPDGVNTGVNIIGDDNSLGNVLTNGANHTIRALGIGVLGRNTTDIVNDGVVQSDGGDLTIDPRTTFTNNNLLAAVNGGTVRIGGGVFDNSGSIDATDGTVVLNGGVTLRGTGTVAGTLEAFGTNTLETLGTNANLRVNNSSDLLLGGTITNNGTITLDGTGSGTELRIDADTTLAGNGQVVIGPDGVNVGVNLIGDDNSLGNVLTNGAGHTIRVLGIGALGRNTTDIVNDGVVQSDGGDLLIDPRSTFTNNGTLTTLNGGSVSIATGIFTNNGAIDATAGTLNLTGGVTLVGGGTFEGTVEAFGTNTLQDLSANANLHVNNSSDLLTGGTITNNGTITLDGTNSGTELRIDDDTTLAGSGQVIIGSGGVNTGVNLIGDDNSLGNVLTNSAGHTIRALGIGALGRNTTNIVNSGDIISDGGALTIDPRNTFTNKAAVTAINSGTINIGNGDFDNQSGALIEIDAGSTLTLSGDLTHRQGATIEQNGAFTINSGGDFINQADDYSPGVSTGLVTVNSGGAFTNDTSGTVTFKLDGDTTPGVDFDTIRGGGIFNLAGTLDLELNFIPTFYESIELILDTSGSNVNGTFEQLGFAPIVAPGDALAITYAANAVLLTRALPGDANLDGFISQGDLDAVLLNWGSTTSTWQTGEMSGDDFVSQADLDLVLLNWGQGTPPDLSAVPEPSTIALIGLGGLLALRRRHRA